jgi:hypothetical protein
MTANKGRKYYIGNEKEGKPYPVLIRDSMLIKYRPVVDQYRTVPLYKQFFKMMKICRDNDSFLTRGECIAILRKRLSTDQPTKLEMDHFNTEVFFFRKWLGALSGIVAYTFRMEVVAGRGFEWVFRPLKNKKEYLRYAGKHIKNVEKGLNTRHAQNLAVFALSKKEINRMIEEKDDEINLEADIQIQSKRNKRRRGSGK